MKAYYHEHESAYQVIKSKGLFGWGNAKSLSELGEQETFDYLENNINKYFPTPTDNSALDLGCGTGTTAFLLSKLGFITTGVDISETAIEMAEKLANQQDLTIKFIAGDVLNLQTLNQKFDFIYDSHLLHCIVFDEDREQVLSEIKSILTPNGIFIVETMILPEVEFDAVKFFAPLYFDEQYILWHKTASSHLRGVIQIDEQYWCAQRRICKSAFIMNEVCKSGFEILESKIVVQPNELSILRLVLKHLEN